MLTVARADINIWHEISERSFRRSVSVLLPWRGWKPASYSVWISLVLVMHMATHSLSRRCRCRNGCGRSVAPTVRLDSGIFSYWWRHFTAVASYCICWRQSCVTSFQSWPSLLPVSYTIHPTHSKDSRCQPLKQSHLINDATTARSTVRDLLNKRVTHICQGCDGRFQSKPIAKHFRAYVRDTDLL